MLMSTVDMRAEVHQMIDEVDNALLEAIHAMLGTYKKRQEKDPIVSYDIDGTPRTSSELTAMLDEQVESGLRGEYTSIENLRKESDQWLTSIK